MGNIVRIACPQSYKYTGLAEYFLLREDLAKATERLPEICTRFRAWGEH